MGARISKIGLRRVIGLWVFIQASILGKLTRHAELVQLEVFFLQVHTFGIVNSKPHKYLNRAEKPVNIATPYLQNPVQTKEPQHTNSSPNS